MEEGEIFEDSENWREGKEGYGFKEICMMQVRRCVNYASREMIAGYWVYTNIPNINPQKIKYFGDARAELTQAIDVLHDLLQPKFDTSMKKVSKEIYETLEKWEAEYATLSREQRKVEGSYWKPVLKHYRKLFQELCFFLERYGWLAGETIQE